MLNTIQIEYILGGHPAAIERPRTKREWRDFADRVLATCSGSPAHRVRWNRSWADLIDVAIAIAPDELPADA